MSEFFYNYDDIYADIYSDSSSDGIHLGLTNKKIVQILNGNENGEVADKARAKLFEKKYQCKPVLNEDSKLTFDRAVDFYISPKNSPTFEVGGYEYKNENNMQTSISNDGTIGVSIKPGADRYGLKSDTVRLLLLPANYDLVMNRLVESKTDKDKPIVLVESPENYKKEDYIGDKTAAEWEEIRNSSMKNGDNIDINIKIGTLEADNHYIVKVEGRDAENIEIEPDGGKQYGFYISQNYQPPKITITESLKKDGDNYVSFSNNDDLKNIDIKISGIVTTETKRAEVSYTISVINAITSDDVEIEEKCKTGNIITMPDKDNAWENTDKQWELSPNNELLNEFEKLPEGLYLVTVGIEAKSSAGISTASPSTRTFYLDKKAPEVSDIQITPIVNYSEDSDGFSAEKDYVNGNITIKANVNDDHAVDHTDYVIYIKNGTEKKEWEKGERDGNLITINFDTTETKEEKSIQDNAELEIAFIPVDKAGNRGKEETKSVIVNQQTDKPAIKFSNVNKSVKSEESISKEQNLFNLSDNNKIRGSVSDDDEIFYIDVLWKKFGDDDSNYASLNGFPKKDVKKSTVTLDVPLLKDGTSSIGEGIYWIKTICKDIYEKEGSEEFLIAIDGNDPVLLVSTPKGAYKTSAVEVEGTVSDSSNKITLERKRKDKDEIIGIFEVSWVSENDVTVKKKMSENKDESGELLTLGKDYTVSNSVVTINWKDTFDCATGGETVTYSASDKYGKTSNFEWSYKEDTVPPKITIVSPLEPVFLGETLNKFQKFTGTASDTDGSKTGSDISYIEYKYGVPDESVIKLDNGKWIFADGADESKKDDWLNKGWQKASGTTEWTLNLDCGTDYKDGATVWFRAVDGAGNKTLLADIPSVSVTVDKDIPEISISSVQTGDNIVHEDSNVYYVQEKQMVISGSVKETYVPEKNGIQECLSISGVKGTLNTNISEEGFSFEYTIEKEKLEEGQNYIIFNAIDKAGQSSSKQISVYLDKVLPTVEITSVSPQVDANGKENNVNGIISVKGTASDNDKISKTVLYIEGEIVGEKGNRSVAEAVTGDNGEVLEGFKDIITKVNYNDGGSRYEYTINTEKYSDKHDIIVRFETTDRAGNVGVKESMLYIDQSTDMPSLTSSNMNLSLTNTDDISNEDGKNLFGMGNQTVYVTATDDDGVESVTYRIDSGEEKTLYSRSEGSITTSVTKSIVFDNTLIGNHSIKFSVKDLNAKEYETDSVCFAIDNDVPIISGIKIGGKTYDENMFVPQTFSISVDASDKSEIKSVNFVSESDETKKVEKTAKPWTSGDITETEGDKKYSIVATDKYGRQSTTILNFKVDTSAPVWKETSGGDDIPTTVAGGQKSKNHLELANLGENGFWYNTDSITLSGKAYDKNNIASYMLSVNGSEYLSNGGPSYSIIASYQQGANQARLTATDTAGNSASREITIYVDSIEPSIENPVFKIDGSSPEKLFIKSNSVVTVEVSASDETSGISKILVGRSPSFDEKDAVATLDLSKTSSESGGKKSGSLDISEKVKEWNDGKHTIYIRAVDASGLSSVEKSINDIIVDKTAPVVEYNSPAEGSDVNKTIIISGTYTEENKSQALNAELYYRKNGDSWIKASNEQVSNLTVSEDGKWSVEFNTNYLDDNTKYDFQMRMVDMAGNQVKDTSDYLTLKVNQNSDRPVIKLNFDTNGNARLNSGTFSGNITDDDGNVSKLYFQAVSAKSDFSDTDAKWKELSVTSGSWEIPNENKLMDGTYFLYFKVVDAKKSSFVTGDTDGLTVPYIQYASNPAVYAPISFSVDTQAPVISDVGATLGETEDATESYELVQNNKVFGGVSYRYAKFKIKASDTVSKADNLTVKVKIGDSEYSTAYNTGDKVYYTEKIDLSSMISGIYQLNVTATDQAQMAANWTRMVIVDNDAPVIIKNVTPSNLVEVTGDFDMTGLVQDDEEANSGIPVYDEAMWYYIPKYSEKDTAEADLSSLAWSTDNFSRSSVAWTLKLGDLAKTIGYDASNESVSDDYKNYVVSGNSALYDIPVWFKIKDNAGNVGYNRENFIHYNPNADKPTVTFIYPGDAEKENGKILMGGVARFQGSANDNEGIEGVYLQFDMNGDGIWENGEGINGIYRNDSGNVYVGDKENVAVNIPVVGGMGFKAKGTLTWTSSIDLTNVSLEEGKTFNVRAIAIDSDVEPLSSAWSNVVEITINNDIPQFGKFYLVQYTDETYSTIKQKIDYNEDVYISGSNWRFEGNATHKDGIKSIVVVGSDKDYSNNGDFAIPVTPNDKGQWSVTIIATDNGLPSHPRSQNISVNVDNTAPVFGGKNGVIEIYRDAYGVEANKLGNNVYIQNSNGGFASLSSRAVESGSGFACAVFYFKRTGSENRIYNVMESSSNKTVLESAKADGKVYVNPEGIPVLYKSTVSRSSTTSIELTTNNNIRVGGLVKIGGSYHKIVGVDATSVTLADEVDTKFNEDVEFVYGMVVDNSGESRKIDGTLKDDDGDGMVESYSKSSSNYTWDVEVPSANIPDGPIEVHVVLFDKAGNTNHKFVTTRISNNAPRIARVRLATDLNGNSTYEDNEKQVFAYLDTDTLEWAENTKSKGTEIWNLDGKVNGTVWTIKNTLQVEPEFVGGTAPFHYIFTKESGTGDAKNLSSPKTGTETGQISQNKEAFVISNSMFDSSASYEDKTNTYQLSFWDSTEETTPCTDSQWTVLNIQLKQDIIDNFAPKVAVKPFYWNNASDNSLYQNSLDNGHIELEADLNFENNLFTKSTGEYDKDPKVSGKIVFRGTAYDDVRLSSLWIKFTDFTFSNYVTEAGYGTNGTSDGYVQAAFYNIEGNSWKVPSATLDNDGWTFEAEDEYFDQKGHKVNWTLTIDTSRIAKVAETDVEFAAMAVDHGKLASSEDNSNAVTESGETDTSDKVYNKPKYRVDVVPYITGLDTVLTDLEVLNPSVYGRSALGKYPVYYYRKTTSGGENAEKIILKGFNISGGTVTFNGDATEEIDDSNAISIPKTAKSGEISIAVNGVSSLNNKNADVEYNLQPNGQNNNILTDNVELAIWEINSKAAISKTGELSEVVMHVNPANGMLGFAFAHSQDLASYPNGITSSYQTWMTDWTGVNQIGFIYDQKGNMFGTNGGTDTYTPDRKTGRFGLISSFWGTIATDSASNDKFSGYTKYRRLRLEYLGYWGNNTSYASNVNRFAKGDCSQFATTNDENNTNLYMLYYDNTLGELKFRAGSYNTTWTYGERKNVNLEGSGFSKADFSFGDFADDAYNEKCSSQNDYNPTYAHTSVVSKVTSGANGNSNAKPGTYYSIAAVKGAASDNSGSKVDVVSVVWYDETNKSLWYSYIENPLKNAGKRNENGAVSTEWATPVPLLTGNAGESCAIAADTDGHIHIAAYSRSNAGSLYYIYLDEYNSTFDSSKNLVKVDSYGSTGQYITMEVAKDSDGKNIPYIGYWMNSMSYPKYTYLVDTSSSQEGSDYYPKAGVDDSNLYTGAWESIMLPTSSAVLRDDINIGLYRYLADEAGENGEKGHKKGEIKVIPKQQNENAGTVNGIAGGNGTSNPVLAYGIAETGAGYIETAQLK